MAHQDNEIYIHRFHMVDSRPPSIKLTSFKNDDSGVRSVGSGLIGAIVSSGFRDEAGPINAFNPSTPWPSKGKVGTMGKLLAIQVSSRS